MIGEALEAGREDDGSCPHCGGEGGQEGSEIAPYYDFGWIDPDGWYKCHHCAGTGLSDSDLSPSTGEQG